MKIFHGELVPSINFVPALILLPRVDIFIEPLPINAAISTENVLLLHLIVLFHGQRFPHFYQLPCSVLVVAWGGRDSG